MAPIIHLVRHAQGFHNLNEENQQLSDPLLTPLGEAQCDKLCKNFDAHDKITHLAASPMRRTLHTCLRSFAPVVQSGKKVIALPDAQEVSILPCDIGSDPDTLKLEFGEQVDFALVRPSWNDKSESSKYYPVPGKLEVRARDVRLWLRELAKGAGDDSQIVLVTHGGILHFLTEDWDGIAPEKGTGWENTELRSYEFVDPEGKDPNASLREIKTSWRRRRGSEIPLTRAEQIQLQEAYHVLAKQELEEALATKAKRA